MFYFFALRRGISWGKVLLSWPVRSLTSRSWNPCEIRADWRCCVFSCFLLDLLTISGKTVYFRAYWSSLCLLASVWASTVQIFFFISFFLTPHITAWSRSFDLLNYIWSHIQMTLRQIMWFRTNLTVVIAPGLAFVTAVLAQVGS